MFSPYETEQKNKVTWSDFMKMHPEALKTVREPDIKEVGFDLQTIHLPIYLSVDWNNYT